MTKKNASKKSEVQPTVKQMRQQIQHAPLFFTSPFPLSLERHKQSGLVSRSSFDFARYTNSIPINLVEFIEAAACFPIVFTEGEQIVPLAVVGLADGLNLFVDAAGQWVPMSYVPAYVRKYPFVLMEAMDERYVLCVDEVSSRVMPSNPDIPFYEDEKPAKLLEHALEFCYAFQQEHEQAKAFGKALNEAGLLTSRRIAIQHEGQVVSALQGFLVLDEQKLAQVPDETWLLWRRNGWAFYIDAIMISMVNWRKLAHRFVSNHVAAA